MSAPESATPGTSDPKSDPAPPPSSTPESAAAPGSATGQATTPDVEPIGLPPEPGPHPLRQRRVQVPLAILLFVLAIPFLHLGLRGAATTTTKVPFSDDFQREALGEHWFATGGFWRPVDGWLYSPGVKNNPLWLRAALPRDVAVEFDVRAEDSDGDIKCEVFGNGRDHASGYVLVFGGWSNSVSIIARLDEHGKDRKERRDRKVEKGRSYHFRIERKGNVLSWFIDGEPFMSFDDTDPLEGDGHDRFALGTWVNDVYFDNVSVTPL